MDGVWAGVIVAVVTSGLTYLGIRYKTNKDNELKPEDPVQTLLKRYDVDRENDRKDIEDLRKRVVEAEDRAKSAEEKVDEVLALAKTKDEQIAQLTRQSAKHQAQYTKLLKRFNTMKLKYEKKDKAAKGV